MNRLDLVLAALLAAASQSQAAEAPEPRTVISQRMCVGIEVVEHPDSMFELREIEGPYVKRVIMVGRPEIVADAWLRICKDRPRGDQQ